MVIGRFKSSQADAQASGQVGGQAVMVIGRHAGRQPVIRERFSGTTDHITAWVQSVDGID